MEIIEQSERLSGTSGVETDDEAEDRADRVGIVQEEAQANGTV